MMTDEELQEYEDFYKPHELGSHPGHPLGTASAQILLQVETVRLLKKIAGVKDPVPEKKKGN